MSTSLPQLSLVNFLLQTGERFSHIVSAADRKGDIGRYLGRLGRYLKQGSSAIHIPILKEMGGVREPESICEDLDQDGSKSTTDGIVWL